MKTNNNTPISPHGCPVYWQATACPSSWKILATLNPIITAARCSGAINWTRTGPSLPWCSEEKDKTNRRENDCSEQTQGERIECTTNQRFQGFNQSPGRIPDTRMLSNPSIRCFHLPRFSRVRCWKNRSPSPNCFGTIRLSFASSLK